jgi:hypothetical protein
MKKLILILLSALFCLSCLASCNQQPEEQDPAETTLESTEPETETEEITTEAEDKLAMEQVDFIVSVPADRQAVVLQLTDPQIIDASQARTADRLSPVLQEYWAADKKEERCYSYLREIITETKPDLILVTGDIVYGQFDDNGSAFAEFVAFMESFGIPWAPVFGNHENESKMGVDWQCEQFVNAEHCLFVQRTLTGNGNYTVGIEQGGKLTRVFFMLDSNGCGEPSRETQKNKQMRIEPGFSMKQTSWYKGLIKDLKALSPDTKISFAFHIQFDTFGDAFALYGTTGAEEIFIDYADNKREGDFGYIGYEHYHVWDDNQRIWKNLKELGVDSIFVGHEHANSASIVYEGIRLQYGMKSSAYDSINYIDAQGNVADEYYSTNTPWVGGSVMPLDADGNIVNPYIYYCKNAGGEIDWDSIYEAKKNQPKVDPVSVRIEFDGAYTYIGSDYTPIFTPGTANTWNKIADVQDPNVEYIELWGWVAFFGNAVGEFGYQINDAEIVWSADYEKTPEQGVIDAAGGKPAARYSIMVPVKELSGEHTVKGYVRDAAGTLELLVEFKLIKAQ